MSHRLLGASLLLAFVAVLPSMPVHAQKKDRGEPKDSAKLNPGSYTGILRTTPGSDRIYVLAIEAPRLAAGGRGKLKLKLVTLRDDFEMQNKESVKVRVLKLPEQFDEKGKAKKYTAKELAQLKGKDKSLPGYESAIEKLEKGQRVEVTLVPVKKKAPANKEKEDSEKKMQVKLIVIVNEADEVRAMSKRRKGN
jgi:hypothetical protein